MLGLLVGTGACPRHIPARLVIITDGAEGIGLPVVGVIVVATTHPRLQVEKGQCPEINEGQDIPLQASLVTPHQLPPMTSQDMKIAGPRSRFILRVVVQLYEEGAGQQGHVEQGLLQTLKEQATLSYVLVNTTMMQRM